MKLKIIKFLSVTNVFLWILFIWMDKIWNAVLHEAVLRKEATYGEMFGPISYFRPKVLYVALAFTIIIPIVLFTIRKQEKKDS